MIIKDMLSGTRKMVRNHILLFLVMCVFTGGQGDSDITGSEHFPDNFEECFCKLAGKIDDCTCDVDTVDYFNNMKIYPRLQSLLLKPYFKYFQCNDHRPCPFWDETSGRCANPNCGVRSCADEEIPPGLKVNLTLILERTSLSYYTGIKDKFSQS